MRWTTLVPPEDAVRKMVAHYFGVPRTVIEKPILEAAGYVLAEDLVSRIDVPGFDRSTKDGYAVRAGETHARWVGDVLMGEAPTFTLGPGECGGIPTGGALPEGASAVVMIEKTTRGDGVVRWDEPVPLYANCVRKGQDVKSGEQILMKGTSIGPKEVGVMAAVGVRHVKVYRPPTATLISTGDEIVETPQELRFGKVLDVNSYTLRMLLEESGVVVDQTRLVNDSYNALKEAIQAGMRASDLVLVSGGSSVGAKDYTARIFDELGDPGVFLHGIRIKPGKPTIAALAENTILFGLPGHPVSAMVVFYEVVEPVLREVYRIRGLQTRIGTVELGEDLWLSDGRETHVMVRMEAGKAYRVRGESGLINMIAKADGKVRIPLGTEKLEKGQSVCVRWF